VLSPVAPSAPAPAAGLPLPLRSRPRRRGLARAVRDIEEAAQALEETRRQRAPAGGG
jgi:hypothetical protein